MSAQGRKPRKDGAYPHPTERGVMVVPLKGGAKVYEVTVDIGRDPITGKRRQTRHRERLLKDVKAFRDRVGHQVRTRTYISPWSGTIADLIDAYLRQVD